MSRLGKVLFVIGMIFLVLGLVATRILVDSTMPFIWVFIGVGVASILGAVFKDLAFFIDLSGQRATKHGLNLGALVIIVTAILVGVNFIGYRHPKKIDVTKDKIHSISEQTKTVLASLTEDLKINAFFNDRSPEGASDRQRFKDLIDMYSAASGKLQVAFIDPILKPNIASAYDVKSVGTVVLEYKGRKTKIEEFTEQSITNGLIKVTRDKNKVIYFLTGHGERDLENAETGLQGLKKYLADASYDAKVFSFIEKPVLPEDCALLVIAGPAQPLFQPELTALRDYLYKGGKLLVTIDPGSKTNLGPFLEKEVGVVFKNNYIIDQLGQIAGGGAATAVGYVYSTTSDITKGFKGSMTAFHLASVVKPAANKPAGVTLDELVKSSPASFSKAEVAGQVKFIEGKDERGPLPIVISAKGTFKEEAGKGAPQEFAAIVAGDTDFLTGQLLDFQLNRDLALNSIASLAKDKDLVSIRPKASAGSQFVMTAMQQRLMFWILVVFLPIGIFSTGGVVWFRRRAA